MILNTFYAKFKKKNRVGRGNGSGLGGTCGKGHKGQKARSGYSKRNCFEGGQTPIHIRLPKFGFKSKTKKNKTEITTKKINYLNESFLNISKLKEKNIIKNKIKNIKIIYNEEIKKHIKIDNKNIKISKKVNENILKYEDKS